MHRGTPKFFLPVVLDDNELKPIDDYREDVFRIADRLHWSLESINKMPRSERKKWRERVDAQVDAEMNKVKL